MTSVKANYEEDSGECQPLSHAERRIEDTPSELHAEKKDSNGSAEDGSIIIFFDSPDRNVPRA